MGIESKIRFYAANSANYGTTRPASAIRYLVYHYTGNDGDTADANARYYRDTVVKASAHYFVDDDEVVQSVGDLRVAWTVGGKKWSDCAQTGGGKLHGICTNANSLNIEMCDVARNGQLMATEKTLANAVELGKLLMARYGIPIERVVRHFDVTGKYCPAYFMDEAKWAAFKARLVEKTEEGCTVTLPVLTKGGRGEAVRSLQHMLNLHGANLAVDGSFGPATDAALRSYQAAHELDADGSCGPASWASVIGA